MKSARQGRQFLLAATLLAALSLLFAPGGQVRLAAWLSHHLHLAVRGRSAPPPSLLAADPLRSVLQAENDRLHALLSLRERLSGEVRAARVVRREPDLWWTELVVEMRVAGSAPPHGTALVITPEGLIGTLESRHMIVVGEGESKLARGTVKLLSAPGHQLSVMVGPSEQPFLLEGRGDARLALRPVSGGAEKEILPGDAVVTSGLGRIYSSRGLRVAAVDSDTHWARFSALSATPAEVLLWWR